MNETTTKTMPAKQSAYVQLVVQQLDAHGNVWRSFASMVERLDLEERLFRVIRAFNMSATRVLVDGVIWAEG